MPRPSRGRLVYSTGAGRVCPGCGRPAEACACAPPGADGAARAGDGWVRVRLDKKARRGKKVTILDGVPLPDASLRSLAAELKRACGTGGAVKDGVIEIQGDQRERLVAELEARGFRVKRAGG